MAALHLYQISHYDPWDGEGTDALVLDETAEAAALCYVRSLIERKHGSRSAQELLNAMTGLCATRLPSPSECAGPQVVDEGDLDFASFDENTIFARVLAGIDAERDVTPGAPS